jgi:Adenylate and Guanylate cyclase catalytic domain
MRARIRALLNRLISVADEPADDDDMRLRKRVLVVAGYILVIGALQLPALAQGHPISWFVAVTLPLVSATNLVVLARTRQFRRYVHVLILAVLLFPAFIELSLGGLAGASAAVVFAFLGPVFALIGLGPRSATAWFIAFAVVVIAVITLDPLISSRIEPQAYPMRLIWYAANLLVPLGITFDLLRYTDVRRRWAEARSQELLTNAIPSIAARLQRGEERIADSYPDTTVLFADLAGFTPWTCWTHYEMRVAISMLPSFAHRPCKRAAVGGVIGRQRILFDLWGDTVNTASRMQSSGVPGRIQVAPSTRDLLLDECAFEERAPVEVKGLGPTTTYLLAELPGA